MSDQQELIQMIKTNQESIANINLSSISNIINKYGNKVAITDLISNEMAQLVLKHASKTFISDHQSTYQILVDKFSKNNNPSKPKVYVNTTDGTAQDVFVYQDDKEIDFDLIVN